MNFVVELTENLINIGRQGLTRKKKQVGRLSMVATSMSNVGDHLAVPGKSSRLGCVRCYKQKKDKRIKYVCEMCDVPLCSDCFTPYHI